MSSAALLVSAKSRPIRVRRRQEDENTNVGYRARHVFPELATEGSARTGVLLLPGLVEFALLIAGAAVLAVVVIDHNTQQGNPVASSSKQVPDSSTTNPGAGTAANGGHGPRGPDRRRVPSLATRETPSSRPGPPAMQPRAAAARAQHPVRQALSINPASAVSPAVNLPVPAHFGPLLRRTWAGANPGGAGIKASDILSTAVGSVFYAEQPAMHTYWAISQFVPSALAESRSSTRAGAALLAEFQGTAVFEKVAAHHWTYVGSFSTGTCPVDLPVPVLTAWGLGTVGS